MIKPRKRSPREKVAGLCHFGRMIDKIRLHLRRELPEAYQRNSGVADGLDGLLAQFLKLTHSETVGRVREDGTDGEILDWCFEQGLRPNETQVRIGIHSPKKSGGAIGQRQP